MTKTLCLDFGNTRLKAAIFEDEELKEIVFLQNDSPETIQNLLRTFQPQRSILSSVINDNIETVHILSKATSFHQAQSSFPFTFYNPGSKAGNNWSRQVSIGCSSGSLFSRQKQPSNWIRQLHYL